MKYIQLFLFSFSLWAMKPIECLRFQKKMENSNYEADIGFNGQKVRIKRFAEPGKQAVPFLTEIDGKKYVIKIDKKNGLDLNQKYVEKYTKEIEKLSKEFPHFDGAKKIKYIPYLKSSEGYFYQDYIEGILVRDANESIKSRFADYVEFLDNNTKRTNYLSPVEVNVVYVEESDTFYVIDPF